MIFLKFLGEKRIFLTQMDNILAFDSNGQKPLILDQPIKCMRQAMFLAQHLQCEQQSKPISSVKSMENKKKVKIF